MSVVSATTNHRVAATPPPFCFWRSPCISTSLKLHPLLFDTMSSEVTRGGTSPPTSLPGQHTGSSRSATSLLWFAYSVADDGFVEVGGEAEYESCEVGSPIRMYTEGLSRVGLHDEGSRYFVSADPGKCKSGLKLRVDVRAPVSRASPRVEEDRAAAPAPAQSASDGTASLMRVLLSLAWAWCFLFLRV